MFFGFLLRIVYQRCIALSSQKLGGDYHAAAYF